MNSKDRLTAIVIIWLIFGLLVGVMCNSGGTQVEEVILSAVLGLLVLAATAQLSSSDLIGRFIGKSGEKPKRVAASDEASSRLLDLVTDDELALLRERLAASDMPAISTFSPPLDR